MSKGVQAAAGGKEPIEFEGLDRWTSSANKLGDLTRSRQTSSEFMTPSKKRRISKGIKATGQDVFPAQVITDWVISNFGAPKFGQYSRMIANDCRRMKFYEVLTTSLRLLSMATMHCAMSGLSGYQGHDCTGTGGGVFKDDLALVVHK